MLCAQCMNKMNSRLVCILATPVHMGQAIIYYSHYRYNGGFLIEEADPRRVVPIPIEAIRLL
jgi:hypothetical protein